MWDFAVDAIKARFRAGWTVTPIMFPNGEGGDDQPFVPPINAPFVHLEVVWTDGAEISVDGALRRRFGHVWIHAFVPKGRGDALAHRNAATAAALFDVVEFDGLVCEAAQPGGTADFAAGAAAWYGQSVSIPFQYDEVKEP